MRGVLTLAALLVALQPRPAVACSQLSCDGWKIVVPRGPIEELPPRTVLGFDASLCSSAGLTPESQLSRVRIDVRPRAGGEPVAGTLAWDAELGRIMWRASADLPLNVVHDVTVFADDVPADDEPMDFRAIATWKEPDPPQIRTARLTEALDPELACCTAAQPGLCGDQVCWEESIQFKPVFTVTWWHDAGRPHETTRLTPSLSDEIEVIHTILQDNGQRAASLRYARELNEYCVTIRNEGLIDGRFSDSDRICVPHANMQPLPRRDPDKSQQANCEGQGAGPPSCTSSSPMGAAWWWVVTGFFWVRRR